MSSQRTPSVVVLCGGTSSERGISLTSGRSVLDALDRERWLVRGAVITTAGTVRWMDEPCLQSPVDALESAHASVREASLQNAMSAWLDLGVEIVFPALHGVGGEDGTLQGALQKAGFAYTGSGVGGSALCMDKIWNRAAAADLGVPVSKAVTLLELEWRARRDACLARVLEQCGSPCFVKPARGGSSLGLSRASGSEELAAALDLAFSFDVRVLVEAECRGVEVSCGVLGNAEDEELQVLEPVEIRPTRAAFFSFEEKYSADGATEVCPSTSVDRETIAVIQATALRLHRGLGLQGMSRTDFLVRPREASEPPSFVMLETNTIPGLTPRSLLPQAAAQAGLSYARLLDRILELGMKSKR